MAVKQDWSSSFAHLEVIFWKSWRHSYSVMYENQTATGCLWQERSTQNCHTIWLKICTFLTDLIMKPICRKTFYHQFMNRHPLLCQWNAGSTSLMTAAVLSSDRHSLACRGQNCWRRSDWHSNPINKQWSSQVEVLKKISPLPDGRQHWLTWGKRCSARTNILASSPSRTIWRRNKSTKSQKAQQPNKQSANKEKGCKKNLRLWGNTATEAEQKNCT